MDIDAAWDRERGTLGGRTFGAALGRLVSERGADRAAFLAAAGFAGERLDGVVSGSVAITMAEAARLAQALRMRAIEFLQRTEVLGLDVYASGLDPLFFLPAGQMRKDARIYMREINPRHAVPERDMFVRNPVLKATLDDSLLDPLGKLEIELTYLLRVAALAESAAGGSGPRG